MKYTIFQSEQDQKHYFNFQTDEGEILLRSQGYTTEAGRDNGIASVMKNASDANKYQTKSSKDGRYYFNLRAANGQVIGTSRMFPDAEAIQAAIANLGSMGEVAGEDADGMAISFGSAIEIIEEKSYNNLSTQLYLNNNDSKYYFHFRDGDGDFIIVSQGYSSKAAAQNGLESVLTNTRNADHFDQKASPNGSHYFDLKASNGQIVATSLAYDSEKELQATINNLMAAVLS